MNENQTLLQFTKETLFPMLLCFILWYMISVDMQNDMYKEIIKVCPAFHNSSPQ